MLLRHLPECLNAVFALCGRELHGDGDDGTTVVMGLNFITDTAVLAGMGTAFSVIPREQ